MTAALSIKYCPDCDQDKPVSEYYKYKNGTLHRNCKKCVGVDRHKYYRANRAKVLDREAARRAKCDWPERCKQYKIDKWAKKLMQSAKKCSRERGHEPPTIDEAWVYAQPLVCPYLGVPLKPSREARGPWAPSLDRIDNSKGYTPDNVRLTSWLWNLMRGALTVEEALEVLSVIRRSEAA